VEAEGSVAGVAAEVSGAAEADSAVIVGAEAGSVDAVEAEDLVTAAEAEAEVAVVEGAVVAATPDGAVGLKLMGA
jgi:hypothetical protein